VSEEQRDNAAKSDSVNETPEEKQKPTQSGPAFTESPDPLSGVRQVTGEAWKNTEGKTVSLRVYIGSIVGVIILMLLARCGG
jgi:hypothetical protein